MGSGPDPRKHQKLRRIDRAAAQDRFARIGAKFRAAAHIAHALHEGALDNQFANHRPIEQGQIVSGPRRPKISAGGRVARPFADRELIALRSLLPGAVEIIGKRQASRGARFHEGIDDRDAVACPRHTQRSCRAMILIDMIQIGFRAAKIGQNVCGRPTGISSAAHRS